MVIGELGGHTQMAAHTVERRVHVISGVTAGSAASRAAPDAPPLRKDSHPPTGGEASGSSSGVGGLLVKLGVVAALVLALVLLYHSVGLEGVTAALEAMRQDPWGPMLPAFLLVSALAVVCLVPGALFQTVAGSVWGVGWGMVVGFTGAPRLGMWRPSSAAPCGHIHEHRGRSLRHPTGLQRDVAGVTYVPHVAGTFLGHLAAFSLGRQFFK